MRLIALMVAAGLLPVYSQVLSVGVKAGVAFTDPYKAVPTVSEAPTASAFDDHFVVGPTVEIHLPFHLSLEADALYRRNGFSLQGGLPVTANVKTSPNDWQVPFLLKYELGSAAIRPFLDTGVVYRHVSGFTSNGEVDVVTGLCPVGGCPPTQLPPITTSANANSAGYALGGGLTLKVAHLRISPEIRFSEWAKVPLTATYIKSGRSQADLLVGFTF